MCVVFVVVVAVVAVVVVVVAVVVVVIIVVVVVVVVAERRFGVSTGIKGCDFSRREVTDGKAKAAARHCVVMRRDDDDASPRHCVRQ